MLKLTVSLIARRVEWTGGNAVVTVPAALGPKAPPARVMALRGPGEGVSFIEREIEQIVQAAEPEPAGSAAVDAGGLRAWWRMPHA